MKFALICIVFIAITGIAILNMSYYRSRLRVITDLIDLFRQYCNDLAFCKSTLDEVINRKISTYSKSTQILLKHYNDVLQYPSICNSADKTAIYSIFDGVGLGDVESEVGYVNHAITTLENMQGRASHDLGVKGILRSKLIFIFGIMLIIILL